MPRELSLTFERERRGGLEGCAKGEKFLGFT
jgi:hypothetical protein